MHSTSNGKQISTVVQSFIPAPATEDYTDFGSFSRCKRMEPKLSTKYMQSPFSRLCFLIVLAVLFFVLISLIIAFIFSLHFIILPHASSFADYMNITNVTNNVTYSTNNAKNISSGDIGNKYSIKVSLFDPGKQNESISSIDHSKLPLTNLTQICMNLKGQCWYHPKKYANSCQKEFCESVEFKVEWNYSMNSIYFNPVNDVFEITPVPDRAPCGPSSWCISGQCTPTNDTRVFHWSKVPPKNGGWENNCENPKCLMNGFSTKSDWKILLMAAKCPGMPCSAYTTEIRRLQFKSCTNPLPSHDGASCDIKQSPILWGPICQDCPTLLAGNEHRKLWPNDVLHGLCGPSGRFLDAQRCSCIRPNGQIERVDEGAPCRAQVNESHTEPGHCFFGKCLTYVGHKSLCNSY